MTCPCYRVLLKTNSHTAKVDDLEKRHGWAITGVVGSQISLTYRREIELVFDASSFKPNTTNGAPSPLIGSRIDLWYVAAARELNPMPLTIEKDFFLQNIRECCRSLPQAGTTVRELLDAVSVSWTRSLEVVDDIRSINRNYPTEVTKTSDSSILVRSTLLLLHLGTKVDTEFNVVAQSTQNGLELKMEPRCTVLYGERFNEAKMAEFLANRATGYGKDKISWGNIITELEEKLLARGRK
jgi:kinetochore protein Spc7/SPC105